MATLKVHLVERSLLPSNQETPVLFDIEFFPLGRFLLALAGALFRSEVGFYQRWVLHLQWILGKGLTRVWAHNLSRVGLRQIAYVAFPGGTGNRDGSVRLFSNPIQALYQRCTTISPRASANTRIILMAWIRFLSGII